MSQFNDTGTKTFKSAGAITKGARVKISAAETVDNAGLTDKCIGTALNDTFAAGERIAVALRTKPGTHKCIAAAAIAAGAEVFSAAAGKVSVSASTAFREGFAMEAAGANNEVFEVMLAGPGDTAVP